MSWQRYNRTTDVFEVSDDNGASWQILKIAPEGLDIPAPSGNIAYKDQANIFTQNQRIEAAIPRFKMYDTSAPANSRYFEIVNYSQELWVQALNDIESTGTTPLKITRPGDVKALRDFYEKNRPTPMGHGVTWAPTFTDDSGTVLSVAAYSATYALIGKLVFWWLYANNIWTTATATANIRVSVPPGLPSGAQMIGFARVHAGTGVYEDGFASVYGGLIYFARSNNTNWPASYNANHISYAFGFYPFA